MSPVVADASFDQDLPAMTQLLVNISDALKHHLIFGAYINLYPIYVLLPPVV